MAAPHQTHQAGVTIAACVLIACCEGFDLQAAGVAAPGIAAQFLPTAPQLGNFFSASTLGLFIGALAGGRLSDSFGRKRTLIVSVVLFGLFSLLTATSNSMTSLVWARFLTGTGFGGAMPNLLALVDESSSPGARRANVALTYSGMPFGGAIASLISMLSAGSHWRVIFFVGGAAPLLLAAFLPWALRESRFFAPRREPGVLPQGRPGSGSAAALRAGSFQAIFADGRGTNTLLLWASSFLALLTLYLLLSWLPTLLAAGGLTHTQAAAAQVGFNVGGAIMALLVGRLLEGRARAPTILLSCAALPLVVWLLSRAPADPLAILPIVFVLGGAVLANQGILYALAPQGYPAAIRGVALGAAVAMGRLGSIVGPKLGGTLRAAGHGTSQLLMDILPLVIAAGFAVLLFARRVSKPQ
ncbi:MAG: MFS transporter [Proteobacteria bacterium]|nr:MFS transporter [Pseudomonadota bacterium]